MNKIVIPFLLFGMTLTTYYWMVDGLTAHIMMWIMGAVVLFVNLLFAIRSGEIGEAVLRLAGILICGHIANAYWLAETGAIVASDIGTLYFNPIAPLIIGLITADPLIRLAEHINRKSIFNEIENSIKN